MSAKHFETLKGVLDVEGMRIKTVFGAIFWITTYEGRAPRKRKDPPAPAS